MLSKSVAVFLGWLTVLLAVAWYGSRLVEDRVGAGLTHSQLLELRFHEGSLTVFHSSATSDPVSQRQHILDLGFVGRFSVDVRSVAGGTYRYVYIVAPLWFVLLLTAPWPLVAFLRGPFRRYRRKKRIECLKCGYSLVSNVSGICPECGNSRAALENAARQFRVTPWHVIVFFVLHVACVACLAHVCRLVGFRRPPMTWLFNVLVFMAPAFGVLWSFVFVGWRARKINGVGASPADPNRSNRRC